MLFLREGVATHFDDFHAVQDGWVQSVQRVRSAQEQHFRKVDGDVKEVVRELIVLLWVKNLQQYAAWITLRTPLPKLINLINEDNRVLHLNHFKSSNNFPWNCTKISSPETFQRSCVSVSTHRYSMVLSS